MVQYIFLRVKVNDSIKYEKILNHSNDTAEILTAVILSQFFHTFTFLPNQLNRTDQGRQI